jgi:large subunit ribosomal protein L24
MMRLRKNDTVVVVSGKDKDKKGKIIEILPEKDKVIVKDLGLVTKHAKARRQGEVGGIKQRESYLHMSKVMPVCTACNKPVRVNVELKDGGVRVRICNKCEQAF